MWLAGLVRIEKKKNNFSEKFEKKFFSENFEKIFSRFLRGGGNYLANSGNRGGKHTNSKLFLENRQSKNFCLT